MDIGERITSRQNPRIQWVVSLQKPEQRQKKRRFLIEGRREVERAMENHFSVEMVFVADSVLIPQNFSPKMFRVTREVFAKISRRENPDGILAVAVLPENPLPKIIPTDALILLAERIEKPGNLGALIRSAEAAGCALLILADTLTDIWNPNAIRASQGAIFALPIAVCSNDEALQFLRMHGVPIIATMPDASVDYWGAFSGKTAAIAAGNEHRGLSEFWQKNADLAVSIPLYGKASDSLNVGIATALCLYEFRRTHR
jgi:TrmH family RNA methyltransferase